MKPGEMLMLGAAGLLAWWIFSNPTIQAQLTAAALNAGLPTPAGSTTYAAVTGGTCPGTPGCPGNVTGYQTNFGVTVTDPGASLGGLVYYRGY